MLQSTAGGAEWDSVKMRFAHYLSTKEQQEVGLLTSMVNRWKQLGLSTMAVTDILEGHQIVFRDGIAPPFTGQVSTQLQSNVETQALTKELEDLLAKGVVEIVPPHLADEGYYSPYFLVQKKCGSLRPILNLRAFNKFVAKDKNKFKMLKIPTLLAMVQPGDWLSSIDLKDAFQHIPVAGCHRKYFRFRYKGVCYQYTRLPFGYCLSPRTLSPCLKAALVVLLRKGIRLAWYLDDLLVMASSWPAHIRPYSTRAS